MKISRPKLSANLSIKSQTIAIMVLGVFVMVTLLSIITSYVVNQQSRDLMLKNAIQITEGLAQQTVFPILSGAPENAETAMAQVLGFQSVINAQLIADSSTVFLEKSKIALSLPIKTRQHTETTITDNNSQYWLVSSPVKIISNTDSEFEFSRSEQDDEIIGYAEVLYSKENLSKAQKNITVIIFVVGLCSVILLSIALHIGLVSLFKPLNALELIMEQAENTGEHKFAKIAGAKEIRNMAHSYNSMMHVLEKHEESITRHRDQLEKEVEVRTKELVLARDTALTASRHKSEFMANMSHELRTPIQSIIGYSELITEELELEGNFTLIDDMDKVTSNAQRLLNMINSLLDLAKIEAGKLDLHPIDIKLSALEVTLNDVISPLALKNNNQFKIINKSQITQFTSDKEKLEQVLINLLGNACKFTQNGQVSLTIYQHNQELCFDIADTGIGLTQAQQQYIFEEFRQVDSGDARKFGGTGLGLAITKRFVELMHGRISVESEIDKGSVFTVAIALNGS